MSPLYIQEMGTFQASTANSSLPHPHVLRPLETCCNGFLQFHGQQILHCLLFASIYFKLLSVYMLKFFIKGEGNGSLKPQVSTRGEGGGCSRNPHSCEASMVQIRGQGDLKSSCCTYSGKFLYRIFFEYILWVILLCHGVMDV